jgi:hypothetical protein
MKSNKLTEQEIQVINTVQKENELIIKEMGLIGIAEINLEQRRERAEDFLKSLREKETTLAKSLEEKYGKGTVNLSTGEFNSI